MIAVISHDAGGAEILSSYVRQEGLAPLFVLEGPARKIFERKFSNLEITTLDSAIAQSETIICGTSWDSDLEIDAIKMARELGKQSIAFIDHWVNYSDRFNRSGVSIFPDEIWVGDSVAESIAMSLFTDIPIRVIDNPYLKDVKKEFDSLAINKSPRPQALSVLYVCEPISKHALLKYSDARYWGYVEHDALRYFLENISVLGQSIERVVIRPHPSEKPEKYSWLKQEFNLPIVLGGSVSLVEEIVSSDVVVGCESMALVVALTCNKKVMSCIPPNGRACVLPHMDILHLQDLVKG